MCGIYFCCCAGPRPDGLDAFEEACKELVKRRGPDFQASLEHETTKGFSSVLWLQGNALYPQPVDDDECTLYWNGDIYLYNDQQIPPKQSDTQFLFNKLAMCRSDDELLAVIQSIQGPFALVFLRKRDNLIYYGRDFFGRQSLMINKRPGHVILTSVAPVDSEFTFDEVAATGIFKIDLANDFQTELFRWDIFPEVNSLGFVDRIMPSTLKTPVNVNSILRSTPNAQNDFIVDDTADCLFADLLQKENIKETVMELINCLTRSVKRRITAQPKVCKNCIKSEESCHHTHVGILFSGGLDSTVLAHVAGQLMPGQSIDLLNVAFQLPDHSYDAPDRLTGRQAVKELRKMLPEVKFNFVEVNITKEELQVKRKERISHLLNPLNTVLDDSIGCAIWFAARGEGTLENGQNYACPARVLIAGMGIDEQLGGYSRHRARFARDGWAGLEDELRMELLRISQRNLGRDNRMVSDHGVMARFPFLDESVVNFISQLDTGLKAHLSLPRGVGEKLVLRVAAHHLGLTSTAREPKRAVQFGSRIAKLENRKEKASDLAVR